MERRPLVRFRSAKVLQSQPRSGVRSYRESSLKISGIAAVSEPAIVNFATGHGALKFVHARTRIHNPSSICPILVRQWCLV